MVRVAVRANNEAMFVRETVLGKFDKFIGWFTGGIGLHVDTGHV